MKHSGINDQKTSYFPEYTALSAICLLSGFPDNCDDHLEPILRETAAHLGIDRILVLKREKTDHLSAKREWCSDGVDSKIDVVRNFNTSSLPTLQKILLEEEIMIAEDTRSLPDDLSTFFESHNANSVVVTRMKAGDNTLGLIFFENCNGQRHWTDSQTSLLITVTGIITNCFRCTSYNSTILAARDKAEQSSIVRGEFITRISHEIRTPLNAIIGLSEALYYKVDSESNKKLIKSMISSGKLLVSVLNDILEISRVDEGKLPVRPEKTDMISMLDETEAAYRDIAAKKNLALIVERSISLPRYLLIDETRTQQILSNLITNAISYTRWGQIKISADFIAIEDKTGRLILRVADTGPGISKDKLKTIFDEYVQYEDNRFYEEGSTGLGLPLSKKITEALGGSIKAESSEGKGSVFTVVLPSEEFDESQSSAKLKNLDFVDIEFINSAILVIDDVPTGIEIIETHVSDSSLKVFSASGLDSALDKLSKNKINLILMDHFMAVVSGEDIVKMIRTKQELQEIPVVAYTAASSTREYIREMDCYDDFLYKPVSRQNLFKLLTRYLKYKVHAPQ